METIETYPQLVDHLIKNKITMCPKHKFETVLRNYNKIAEIEGDIVECGVWRGGFSIFMAHIFEDRNIWVSDSFEGFQPTLTAKYNDYDKERHVPNYTQTPHGPIAISLEEVQNHFNTYGLGDDPRIKYLKGFVKDSLPTSGIEKISLLRVDVDAYSATLEVLDELYDKVSDGGIIIFDDSSLYESLDAIKQFFENRGLPPFLLNPKTDEPQNMYEKHIDTNSGLDSGCYIIKGS